MAGLNLRRTRRRLSGAKQSECMTKETAPSDSSIFQSIEEMEDRTTPGYWECVTAPGAHTKKHTYRKIRTEVRGEEPKRRLMVVKRSHQLLLSEAE